ncbi:Bardet-Biedl syndrome 5 -like protein [Trichinella britovi]|uniref:Bardet-Biedl syndrome 5-like protein n=1 Tax=Trichinella britovi TaxID=45882 RepID=A0A0V1C6R6_TRIBR|nr:Bardet-Biedl syndrome 5 -like protein [Trichinella britovi]
MFKSVEKNLKHYDVIWEDREFRYDVDSKQLKLRNGEFIVDKLHGIENTKGNREHKDLYSPHTRNRIKFCLQHFVLRAGVSVIWMECIMMEEAKAGKLHLRGSAINAKHDDIDKSLKNGSHARRGTNTNDFNSVSNMALVNCVAWDA